MLTVIVVAIAALIGLGLIIFGIGSQAVLAEAEQHEKVREFTR